MPEPDRWPDFNAIPLSQYPQHRHDLLDAYRGVRAHTLAIAGRFSEAQQQIQSMPDASPTKWHLAHTTWFFETFILQRFSAGYAWINERYCYLFNSYYNAVGPQFPRPERGLIERPDLSAVHQYRDAVDQRMLDLLATCDDGMFEKLAPLLVLGLNHEQQHQELIRTDIKHGLFQANSEPVDLSVQPESQTSADRWSEFEKNVAPIGYGGKGFCFDNELARHEVMLPAFRVADSPVSCGEWLAFMNDGGYQKPLLWLSDGWQWKNEQAVEAPLYWKRMENDWYRFTVDGWLAIDANEPVRHISYYEADAFAAWKGARLPREQELEWYYQERDGLPDQAWEWTQSAYSAYPGFRPRADEAGEYNGKFMVNQMVLRGSSPATAAFHSRPTYRNFFYPHARWQFSGLRLATDQETTTA